MNQTEPIIRWEASDNRAFAHIEISEQGMTLEGLARLSWKLKQVYDEMAWYAARFLGAGMKNRGNMHVLSKSDYEQNKACAALCGKSIAWEVAFVLGDFHPHGKGVCKACSEAWEQAQAAESEASHEH